MFKFMQILCLCCLFSSFIQGQFIDNFDDGNFSDNPTWLGDTENFIVNSNNRLQLNATDAGTSTLHTAYSLTADFSWTIELSMDFSPSNNNNLSCYFMIDNNDPSIANGYFFSIGENLSEDNLKIFKMTDGIPDAEPLAQGQISALATDPAFLNLRMERVEGLWSVYTSYAENEIASFELSFFDDTYDFIADAFWVLNPKYTASNVENFAFDNISAQIYTPDITPPTVSNFSIISANQLEVSFDEAIDAGIIQESNFELDPNIAIDNITFTGTSDNQVLLTFTENFSSGVDYTLTVNGISDLNGNISSIEAFSFSVSEAPVKGDLLINEVLFNPFTGGSDYIEIISVSDKLLNLEGLVIANLSKNEFAVLEGEILLEAGDIVCISEDTLSTIMTYEPVNYYLVENNLPSFNLDEGNYSILLPDATILDSFDYSEDFHLSLLDEPKGVSLERIFTDSETIGENFVSGVASTNYGTPGYENANARDGSATTEDVLNIDNDVFSPNGDGQEDQLIMRLNYPENSYLTTIEIYNTNGQKVKTLVNNQLSASMDIVSWDGTLDDGGKAYIGHYIVVLKAFRENGDTLYDKKHVKLLDFF
jgi:hypothetical protein